MGGDDCECEYIKTHYLMEYPLLLEFLDTRLEAALDQERFNRQTIHLYRCGDSWLALEYSACLLEERFHYKDKKPLIFHLRDGRRVVMVEVPASYVRRIAAGHETGRQGTGHITLDAGRRASDYAGWKEWILDD
jgi:hypothetical protein